MLLAASLADPSRPDNRRTGDIHAVDSSGWARHNRMPAAATGEGLAEVMAEAMEMLRRAVVEIEAGERVPQTVFHPQPRRAGARVYNEGDTFVVVAPEAERIVARVDMTDPEVLRQFRRQLQRLGVSRALEKAGVKPGDRVRCGSFIWEW